jgi:hypothetical protein
VTLNHGDSVFAKEWDHVENGFPLALAPAAKKRRPRRIKLRLTLIYSATGLVMEGHPECLANILRLLCFRSTKTSGSRKTCHRRECFAKNKNPAKTLVSATQCRIRAWEYRLQEHRNLYDSSTWFFFVTKIGVARWLVLDGLAEVREIADYNYLLRGKDCCTLCAVSQVTTRSLVLL